MSAQRKLISILAQPLPARLSTIAIAPRPRSSLLASRSTTGLGMRIRRSIVTTPRLLRPAESSESQNKEENKTVPSEQLTEEAKKAEPDAAEQVEEVSCFPL